jgi:hypothetical protein
MPAIIMIAFPVIVLLMMVIGSVDVTPVEIIPVVITTPVDITTGIPVIIGAI